MTTCKLCFLVYGLSDIQAFISCKNTFYKVSCFLLRWCLHGSESALAVGWPFLPRSCLPVDSLVKFVFVYMRGGPVRDLAINYPRSRLEGLETKKSRPSYYACVVDPALLEGPENSHVKARWNSALLLGLVLPRGLATQYKRFYCN